MQLIAELNGFSGIGATQAPGIESKDHHADFFQG